MTRQAAITGVGRSACGRRLGIDPLLLATDAVFAAVADAGLTLADIDGLACWPGRRDDPGVSPVGIWELQDALRLKPNWYAGGVEGPAQLSAFISAVGAIAAGQARHVLCFRVTNESSRRAADITPAARVDDWRQWLLPFGATGLVHWAGLAASRYFHAYGTTREQLGAIAINARRNAALNHAAPYRDALDMDAYLGARMISSPLCLLDCDIPVDGAVAFVLSAPDAARDGRARPVWIEAIAGALHGRSGWDQQTLTDWGPLSAARRLWSLTDLTPDDVDFAELYDGFSYLTLSWLEALGFCGTGEAGDFVAGGHRIARDGVLPIHLSGGQLSGGRLHGFGLMLEAVTQLRGEAGARQLAGDPTIAAVSNGGGPWASCALLVRD